MNFIPYYSNAILKNNLTLKIQIRNMAYDGRTCLDSPARKKDLRKAVGLYPCHNQGGNQVIIEEFFSSRKTCILHHNKPPIFRISSDLFFVFVLFLFLFSIKLSSFLFSTIILQIANIWSDQCVDSAAKPGDMHMPIGLWPCHGQGGNQVLKMPISIFQLSRAFAFFYRSFLT